MSLKDDLLRNRRVFELLTESEGGGTGAVPPPRKNIVPQDFYDEADYTKPFQHFEPEAREIRRQVLRPQSGGQQNTESFSLEFGRRVNRETGMALTAPIEGIAFPELRKAPAPTASDPLEGLYHRLEAEARRTSQLLGGEEY